MRIGKKTAGGGPACSEVAHPTRFERVTFACGGQRQHYPDMSLCRCSNRYAHDIVVCYSRK